MTRDAKKIKVFVCLLIVSLSNKTEQHIGIMVRPFLQTLSFESLTGPEGQMVRTYPYSFPCVELSSY